MNDGDFAVTEPPDHVWRIAYGSDPTALRPWNTVSEEAPPNGRFDDDYPAFRTFRTFRTLYTSSTKVAALREVLRDFRPATDLLQAMHAVESEDGEPDPSAGIGEIPASWLATRCIGDILVQHPAPCVNIVHSRSLDAINVRRQLRVSVANVLSPDRNLTRSLARLLWSESDLAGVAYPSIEGAENTNFAFFETDRDTGIFRTRLDVIETSPMRGDDADLVEVAQAFGLRVPGFEETHNVSFLFPDLLPWHEHIALQLHRIGVNATVRFAGSTDSREIAFVTTPGSRCLMLVNSESSLDISYVEFEIQRLGETATAMLTPAVRLKTHAAAIAVEAAAAICQILKGDSILRQQIRRRKNE